MIFCSSNAAPTLSHFTQNEVSERTFTFYAKRGFAQYSISAIRQTPQHFHILRKTRFRTELTLERPKFLAFLTTTYTRMVPTDRFKDALWAGKSTRSQPGIEPGTTSTLKTYHTPRPLGLQLLHDHHNLIHRLIYRLPLLQPLTILVI